MKHFKFMKGIFAGLLSLALVAACFIAVGAVGAKATEETPKKVSFKYTENETDYIFDVTNTYVAAAEAVAGKWKIGETDLTGKVTITAKDGTPAPKNGDKVTITKTTTTTPGETEEDDPTVTVDYTITDGFNVTVTDASVLNISGDNGSVDATFGGAVAAVTEAKQEITLDAVLAGLGAKAGKTFFVKEGATVGVGDATGIAYADEKFTVSANSADITIDLTASISPIVLTATYKPEDDTVLFESNKKDLKVYYASVKAASGAKVSKPGNVTLEEVENETDENKKYAASISLSDSSKGVKVAENKNLFLWYDFVEPDKKTTNKASNTLKVNGLNVKKFSVTLNYASLGFDNVSGISSIKIKSASGETTLAADKYETVEYRYKADAAEFTDWALADTFKGDILKTIVNAQGSPELEFRIVGVAYAAATDTTPERQAVRCSKALSIKISTPGAAPKVKVDYVKGTVSIKNGYDYAIMETDTEPTDANWITILPCKAGGTGSVDGIATSTFNPVKKVTENAAMFTATKVKALTVDDLFKNVDATTIYVYVRKSASVGKSASKAAEKLTIVKPADASTITFGSNVVDDGVFNKKKNTWSYTLTTPEALASGYEYLIVPASTNLASADLSAAKWGKLGASLVVGKAKTKLNKTTAVTLAADGSVKVLIRKAAVKSGADAAFASNYIVTTITKADTAATDTAEATSKTTWAKES